MKVVCGLKRNPNTKSIIAFFLALITIIQFLGMIFFVTHMEITGILVMNGRY